MKEEIIKLLKEKQSVMSHDQLMNHFFEVAPDLVVNALNELNLAHQIGISLDNKIYLIDNEKYFKGSLKINPKGFGFVNNLTNVELDDYFVPGVSLHNALSNDLVVYQLEVDDKKPTNDGEKKYRAVIVNILERPNLFLVGELNYSADHRFLDFFPTNQEYASFRVIMINKQDFKLKENLLLKVKILRSEGRKLFVRIIKVIGNGLKAADRILAIAEEFNLKTEFNQTTLNNAKQVGISVSQEQAELKKRLVNSIEDRLMVTIDGVDSKDLDDSICVEKINDQFRLTVAIADVSHYVLPNSALDREALIRGNSTYLVNVVIPMLPEILANGVCSLNPNEQKFCMVAEILFSKEGFVIDKKVYQSVMSSKARLNYDEVNKFFAGEALNHDAKVGAMLKDAYELHKLLEKISLTRGTINFEIREPKIILDENSNVKEITARTSGEAEKLIENFMVSANEAVASIIFEKGYPFVYRNHGKPKEEDLIQ
jgi:ribonuclease R